MNRSFRIRIPLWVILLCVLILIFCLLADVYNVFPNLFFRLLRAEHIESVIINLDFLTINGKPAVLPQELIPDLIPVLNRIQLTGPGVRAFTPADKACPMYYIVRLKSGYCFNVDYTIIASNDDPDSGFCWGSELYALKDLTVMRDLRDVYNTHRRSMEATAG